MTAPNDFIGTEIAIVGMAGRFPGAEDIQEFWKNLRGGTEAVTFYSRDELINRGEPPHRADDPNFVPAVSELNGMDQFDADFFGFSPRDTEIMDPQHRIFLECAWHALEHAGYDPGWEDGAVGVYAGIGPNDYFRFNLLRNQQLMDSVGEWLARHTSNDTDFFSTRISYELDLRGPSVNVQTACSTSLVAVHLAGQSLISGESDMALAGGVRLFPRGRTGYIYRPGEILSPGGHCRAFDADAQGTIFGSGAGVVVLKRYEDALADGDTIHAVIRGSAVNNDGSRKAGYMAPSVEGQASAVAEAIGVSGIDPDTLSYIEAHGTGTSVGDPIEVRALTQAFRTGTSRSQYCGIGSVKSNIGHLDHAAGVASLIKTVLALKHKELPPTLNFERPNPRLEIEETPFYVNDELRAWTPPEDAPRRAGVNSLGIGGTNAFIILEEAPGVPTEPTEQSAHVIPLSARSESALDAQANQLADHLNAQSDHAVADVAYTLQMGRKAFLHRRAVIAPSREEAIAGLNETSRSRVVEGRAAEEEGPVAFLFPGQGAQHATMGQGLYEEEEAFRRHVDQCADTLTAYLDRDLRDLLFPSAEAVETANAELKQTAYTQPALFTVQYATARFWMDRGIEPSAMIGHSIGEYTAACLSGVMELEDALRLVAERGRLMQSMQPGSMLAVGAPEDEVQSYLNDDLSLSVVNTPTMCVVGGPDAAVEALEERLQGDDIPCRPLHTSHAFHSDMMEPALDPFREVVEDVDLHPPTRPFVSNRSGTWITEEEATDPDYWVQHIRQPVRFSDGIKTLLDETNAALLEVGPGTTLSTLTQRHPDYSSERPVVHSLPHPDEEETDVITIHRALGKLWTAGVSVDWESLYASEKRRRVPLPQYPFERKSYWIEPDPETETQRTAEPDALTKQSDIDDWFYVPSWTRSSAPSLPNTLSSGGTWLVFEDEVGVADAVIDRVRETYQNRSARDDAPRRLTLETPGDLDSFRLESAERTAPEAGQVELRVHAAALQFKDVLMAVGMYADEPVPMGAECVGTVVRVGEGVSDLDVGDVVLAAGFDSFRRYVTRDVRVVERKPADLSIEDAVTIPSGFLTAYHSLVREANLQPGERVLIHAATGGVGQSAVQIAQMIGAEVYGTAGSPRKRSFLRDQMGVEYVYDSRSLDFADGILDDTDGEGIDVVLNSLTDEAIIKGLELLRPHGRFVELGKKDLYDPDDLPDVPNRDTIDYTVIDMDVEREEHTEDFQALFREVMDHVEAGRLEPLSRTAFHWEQAQEAFQYMSQTKHIGKVVLTMEPMPPRIVRVAPGTSFERVGGDRYTIRPGESDDYAALLQAVNTEELKQVVHAWNVTAPSDDRSEAAFWQEEQDRIFFSLFELGKALAGADPDDPLSISVFSNGMQRVASEQSLRPSKATALGPCRVLPREFPGLPTRSIDLPSTDAGARHAEEVARELLNSGPERFVAYRGMDRWVSSVEPAAIEEAEEVPPIRENGVYLITGGLGGVGLTIAEHLARSARVRLVLTSRSGLPPRSEWGARLADPQTSDAVCRKIEQVLALESHGAEVFIGQADVTDREAMQSLVDAVRGRWGEIQGVIHAAGVVDDNLIPLKDRDEADRVLAPKVEGALVLDAVLDSEALDFFVLFSSVSALVGLPGQIDYTAANAFLDAFAQRKAAVDGTPAMSINWSAWQEVGMAADIADKDKEEEGHEATSHSLLGRLTNETAEEAVFETTWSSRSHWVLDGHRNAAGAAVLPGTGYLEIARAAVQEVRGDDQVELHDVSFVAPLDIPDGARRRVRVRLQAGEDGDAQFTIESQWADQGAAGNDWQEHAHGRARSLSDGTADRLQDLDAIADRCNEANRHSAAGTADLQEDHIQFGPRWHCLRQVKFGKRDALGELELPDVFAGELQDFPLHPAVLDMATGCGLPLVDGYDPEEALYVPVQYESITSFRPLPQRLFSHVRCHNPDDREMPSFDVTLLDEEGRVVAEIESFTMRRATADVLTGASSYETHPSIDGTADGLALDLSMGILPSEGVQVFDRLLQAHRRLPQVIVSTVELRAWKEQLEQESTPDSEAPSDQQTDASTPEEAAQDDTDGFVAPRDEIEEEIASIWQDMLGRDRVGVQDDFFEIGGHSLIAVRMMAKVKKAHGVDLPLSVLIEAPTLGGFSDAVRDELGLELPAEEETEEATTEGTTDEAGSPPERADEPASKERRKAPSSSSQTQDPNGSPASEELGSDGATASVVPPGEETRSQDRWDPLVPIQKEGDRLPFFCVHGAGGNILNFRDLAKRLGNDQPVYGLQARGVEGKRSPHERIEDMAAEYVASIRSVQPEGPYRLGGYSAGGVVAFEMAHQLRRQGEEVAVLAFLDTFCPRLPDRPSRGMVDKIKKHVERITQQGWTYGKRYVRDRMGFEQNRLRRLKARFHQLIGKTLPVQLRDIPMVEAYFDAVVDYEIEPYPGSIVLFTARNKGHVHEHVPDHLGWEGLAEEGLAIHKVPGTHDDLMREPNVRVLAEQLEQELDEVRSVES